MREFYKKKWFKIAAALLLLLIAAVGFFYYRFRPAKDFVWGINYSPDYMRYLGHEPQRAFEEILSELRPQKVRLTAYWEDIEPKQGKFDFALYDNLLNQAQNHDVKVILVVGRKQPRWPECHQPDWVKTLPVSEQQSASLEAVKTVINHFKSFPAIERWQTENEPFFNYGQDCPTLAKSDLAKEVSLVKSLDSRPVVITDSGEKGGWFSAASLADIFGPTMYRKVYDPKWGGYVTYPIPPAYYRLRAGMLQIFTGVKEIVGVELQAEPWLNRDIHEMPMVDQLSLMNPQILSQYTDYAKAVGFKENYLWGAEWWYWLKNTKGNPSMWNAAQNLMKK